MRIVLLALVWMLAACMPSEDEPIVDEPGLATCGANGLQHLIGQPVKAHDFTSEGRPLRILPPGSAMTMDHRPDRLNVELDDDGRITRIWCG